MWRNHQLQQEEVDLEEVLIHFLCTYSTHRKWRQIVSSSNAHGQTMAHISVTLGYSRFLQHLFIWEIDINAVDSVGSTALHYAYLFSQEECARFLTHSGANQFVLDDLGRLPSDLDSSLKFRSHSNIGTDGNRVGNVRVGSVTSVELRKNDNKHYYNDESPYKCGMKQEHETLATRVMYLPRVLPNARYSATK
jgi:ankyrin repeat protein